MIKKVTFNNGQDSGTATYKILELDSDILGFKTAKIESINANSLSKKELIKKLVQAFIKEKIDYVTFRLNAKDRITINLLEETGFRLVDEYLTLIKEVVRQEQKQPYPVKVREANFTDSEPLQNSLAETFIYSRFFNDPLIKKEAAINMHKIWIHNCIEGKAAQKVYVAEVDGERAGFIAVEMNKKEGHITLISVGPKYRGRRISEELTSYAINNWFIPKGAKTIRIETQFTNTPALNAYKNMGFEILEKAITLRWVAKT